MDILEKMMWLHLYQVREYFKGKVKTDDDFKKLKDEIDIIYARYQHTNCESAARWLCHGLLEDPVLCRYYTEQAVENGYSKTKIEDTIATLKKRVK